jgi:cytosine/creatinine deaminase
MMHPKLEPPKAAIYRMIHARVSPLLVEDAKMAGVGTQFVPIELVVEHGRIAALELDGAIEGAASLPVFDLDGGLIFPRFIDIHTHLDKGHIAPRSPNPDGTFMGARASVAGDREAYWSAADVRGRMEFSLRSALAHGTGALRTHLDSIGKQTAISWQVFAEVREAWKDRLALQAVALFPVETAIDDEAQFRTIVATVARHGGVLGGVTFLGEPPGEKLRRALDLVFSAAKAWGLSLDFHVDESDSVHARSLEFIADAVMRHKFDRPVVAGHCCSLALMQTADCSRVVAKAASANVSVVCLPMVNMYLQDRVAGRTPRWRGVAPVHEIDAAGARVLIASDNTRDPFFAYGDLDMLEVYREATRVLHLDHSARPWLALLGPLPAATMELAQHGKLRVGGPADLVLTRARTAIELLSRPQSERAVLIAGTAINTTPPDYRELDTLTRGDEAKSA